MSDRAVIEFMNATGATPSVAKSYLTQTNNDVGRAIINFKKRKSIQRSSSNVATFSDLKNSQNGDQQFFNGGEKSGLAVTNPNEKNGGLVDELINKAKENVQDELEKRNFGRGVRLGDVQDEAEEPEADELLRTMYFWKNGFSIDDGPLYSFDDPKNQEYLRAMSLGRAPIELLGAEAHQMVNVRIVQRRGEEYIKPKRVPTLDNSGSGRRLGGVSVVTNPSPLVATVPEIPHTGAEAGISSTLGMSGDAPVQIRLADGSSHRLRFNSDGPIQQLYDYVEQTSTRPFVLQLMPRGELKKEMSLREGGVVGSVVVQRYI